MQTVVACLSVHLDLLFAKTNRYICLVKKKILCSFGILRDFSLNISTRNSFSRSSYPLHHRCNVKVNTRSQLFQLNIDHVWSRGLITVHCSISELAVA